MEMEAKCSEVSLLEENLDILSCWKHWHKKALFPQNQFSSDAGCIFQCIGLKESSETFCTEESEVALMILWSYPLRWFHSME